MEDALIFLYLIGYLAKIIKFAKASIKTKDFQKCIISIVIQVI
jgi:hypothetical protein